MSLLSLPPNSYRLEIRQQPREALVVAKGKEKARKSVDPPPIVQLNVKREYDPQQNFLQNPYMFMAVSLYKADRDEPLPGNESLIGTLSSSLHRLKDANNQDVGLFVFGDISVKMLGTYRLHFRLFEFNMDSQETVHLSSVTSSKFNVLAPKDFRGMEESSHLSRSIADQGVRLRLRKEARTGAGSKRPYPYDSPVNITPARPNLPNEFSSSFEGENSPLKRDGTYSAPGQAEASLQVPVDQTYATQPPFKRSYQTYPSVGQQNPINTPYTMMTQPNVAGQHHNLISPPGVLASNTTASYPVENLGMYSNPTYPSSSSTYQGAGSTYESPGSTYQSSSASYQGTGFPQLFFNNFDNNLPR